MDNEVLGEATALPTPGSPKVIEKLPEPELLTNFSGTKGHIGWKVKTTNQNADIKEDYIYSDAEILALTYKKAYGEMQIIAQFGDLVVENTTQKKKYALVDKALEEANTGDTIKLLASTGIPVVQNAQLKKGVTLQQANGNTVKATADGTYINVAADGAITLCTGETHKQGEIEVSRSTEQDDQTRTVTVDGFTLSTANNYTVKAWDDKNRTKTSHASVDLGKESVKLSVNKGKDTYGTFTSTDQDTIFYIGEYETKLDWRNRTAAGTLPQEGATTGADTAKLSDSTKLPYHKQENYTMTIVPEGKYKFPDGVDKKVYVSMADESGQHTKMLDAKQFTVTKENDKEELSVKITVPVTGALRCYMGPVNGNDLMTHEMTDLTIELKASGTGSQAGTFTVKALGKDYTPKAINVGENTVSVPKDEALSVTFIPAEKSMENPYYDFYTGEKGSTFSLLTGLKAYTAADDTTGTMVDLTQPTQEKSSTAKNGGIYAAQDKTM